MSYRTELTSRLQATNDQRWGVLIDDLSKPPRAALVSPAAGMTPALMNELLTLSLGITFVAITEERAAAFNLELMERAERTIHGSDSRDRTAILNSVEAREGVSTGISAADRAATLRALGADQPSPRLLVKPGHVFPVKIATGGVLARSMIPEAAHDLGTAWWRSDVTLFMDLLNSSGEFLPIEEAITLAKSRGAPLATIGEVLHHRLANEQLVHRVAEAALPSVSGGALRAIAYRSVNSPGEHLALVRGDLSGSEPILTRVQTESTVSDLFGGNTPPTRRRIEQSLRMMNERGCGVFLYLRRTDTSLQGSGESRTGFGEPPLGTGDLLRERGDLEDHIAPLPAAHSMRGHGIGAQILRDLGVTRIELLTTSPKSLPGLDAFGIEVSAQRILSV